MYAVDGGGGGEGCLGGWQLVKGGTQLGLSFLLTLDTFTLSTQNTHSSFWDFVKPADHQHVYAALGQLILNRSGVARLQCGIRTSFQDYFLPMSVTLQYGSLGIVCSLWEAETTRH